MKSERHLIAAIVILAVLAAGIMVVDLFLIVAHDRLNHSIVYIEAPR